MRFDARPRRSGGREHRHRLRTDIFRARVCVDSAQWKVIRSALGKRNVRLAGHHTARARGARRGAARRGRAGTARQRRGLGACASRRGGGGDYCSAPRDALRHAGLGGWAEERGRTRGPRACSSVETAAVFALFLCAWRLLTAVASRARVEG